MRHLLPVLLVGCAPGTIAVDGLDAVPGEGWADEPWASNDTGDTTPETTLPWDEATLRIASPKSATVLPLGELHHFEVELTGPSGIVLPTDDVDVVWTSNQDISWLGIGPSFDDDGLDAGIHSLTAKATLPDGTTAAHTVGAVLVQSEFSGTYAGLYSVDVIVAGLSVPCTGATTVLVEPPGDLGYGEGECLVSIPLLGGDIALTWVFDLEIDVDGVVGGTIGVSAAGLFTYDFPAEGTVDPLGAGFDVTFAGSIPFVGDVDGFVEAPRVSIQSF